MRKLIVATIGFEEKFMIRAITRHGLDRGDQILLLTGPSTEKSMNTVNLIRGFITKYYDKDVVVHVKEVPVNDFLASVLAIKQSINERSKESVDVIVNLSGGMRILVIATLLALATLNLRNVLIEIETEDYSSIVNIPAEILLLGRPKLSRRLLDILRILIESQEPLSVNEIAEKLQRDASTIRRHLIKLRKMKLVEAKKPKPLILQPSPLARLLLM
ncbi:MAG: CRISPR-associated CARF protein Csa3 [Candidatus Bathyarchaeia archaeon]